MLKQNRAPIEIMTQILAVEGAFKALFYQHIHTLTRLTLQTAINDLLLNPKLDHKTRQNLEKTKKELPTSTFKQLFKTYKRIQKIQLQTNP